MNTSAHPYTAAFLGAGIHSCLGCGVDANIESLRQPPARPTLHKLHSSEGDILVPYKLLSDTPLDTEGGNTERLQQAVENVIQQALSEAALSPRQLQNMPLYLGSSSFEISTSESLFKQELAQDPENAIALREPSIGNLAGSLANQLGIRAANYSFNTACTASANALLTAATHIQQGLIEHALVVGVELFNEITALGFYGLDLLTADVMKPFDANRDGLVLGEGISALVLGRKQQGDNRFYLQGGANLCDTYSISASDPEGSIITQTIQQALAQASVSKESILAIKAHGTASLSNDESEAAGMHQVFTPLPLVCALKPHIGHTLGGCGLNELILFYRAAEAGFAISTSGISANAGDLGVALNQHNSQLPAGNFMLNYFGFGGSNTSLVIGNQA